MLSLLALVPAAPAAGQAATGAGKLELRLPVSAATDLAPIPESVDVDERTRSYFTAATVGGTIYRGSLDDPGTPAEVWLPAGADGRLAGQGVEIDDERRLLLVATATQGTVDVYDLDTRHLVGQYSTGLGGYINDITVTPGGDVYFTDSFRPTIFRVRAADVRTKRAAEPIAIPQDGPFSYSLTSNGPTPQPNALFNAGGIVALDDRTLIVTQINEGRLFRLTVGDGAPVAQVAAVPIDGPVDNLDGLERRGETLWATDNLGDVVDTLQLAPGAAGAHLAQVTSEPNFCSPTGVALVEGTERLVVVNAQLFRPTGAPFTVSSLPLPLDGTVDDNPDRGQTLVPCQRDLAAAGPPAPTGPEATPVAGDPGDARAREAAKIQVSRARILPGTRTLDVLATITSRATGQRVPVSFRAAGRVVTTTATVTHPTGQEIGRLVVRRRLPRAMTATRTGILTIGYPGSGTVRPLRVRLRAARHRARLGTTRPVVRQGRLRARGTVASRTGSVQLQLVWRALDRTRTYVVPASVRGGTFRFDVPLPAAVKALLRARQGKVESYTTYVGSYAQRRRGEQQAGEVLQLTL